MRTILLTGFAIFPLAVNAHELPKGTDPNSEQQRMQDNHMLGEDINGQHCHVVMNADGSHVHVCALPATKKAK